MQWRPERNAGFSRADPQRLYLPPVMDAIYGYEAVNVEAQQRDPSSLLNWTRRMLNVRASSPVFGRGTLTILKPGNRKILAYLRERGDGIILCVANLARSAQPVELDLARFKGRVPVEMMGRTPFPPIGELPYLLTLAGHGFLWFRLASGEEVPAWHEERLARDELPVLVLFDGWASLFRDRVVPWRIAMAEKVRAQLEREVLPSFLAGRRWYAAKGESLQRVAIADYVVWERGELRWLVAIADAEREGGDTQTYLLPLTLAWEDGPDELLRAVAPVTIAKVREQARVGVLADAFGDDSFCRALIAAIGAGEEHKTTHGTLRGVPTREFAAIAGTGWEALPIGGPGTQSSNTIVGVGERLFLKAYRRLQAGINPEAEMGRFLTEVARFPNSVPVAGTIEYVLDDGRATTLALLQGFVDNQGDGWEFTINHLDRHFELRPAQEADAEAANAHGGYLALVRTLGARTGELHAALARSTGDAAFDPEPIAPEDIVAWTQRVHRDGVAALDALARRSGDLSRSTRTAAELMLARRDALLARINGHSAYRPGAVKTRLHGDYHLAQVLLVQNDFVIVDFEGEPTRTLAERREKRSPLKDVAGMLRSFDYAMHVALTRADGDRQVGRAARVRAGRAWLTEARRMFLDGYEEVAVAAGLALPRAEATGLLELFLFEKVIYELAYEIDHRPDWVHVPLRGLADILSAAQ